MRCPSCKEINRDRVVDSRMTDGGRAIRRRRECTACGRRYTTKERIEEADRLTVIKNDGSRVPFDRDRVLNGIRHACYKRPVPQDVLERMTAEVDDELSREYEGEVPSRIIGARVARKLRDVDQIAYVRFASVYRKFQDLDEFIEDIEYVKGVEGDLPGQQKMFDG